jgi:hypothetical protein
VPSFSAQSERDRAPVKNERVEFLNLLLAEQNSMLDKLRTERCAPVSKPVQSKSFAQQIARGDTAMQFWTIQSCSESKYEGNPLKSLRRIWPRVTVIKITPPSKKERTLEGREFWTRDKRR